jgi:hypothetical protein
MTSLAGKTFRVAYDFEACGSEELSVKQGELVVVSGDPNEDETNADGWIECVVASTGQQGFVPASYLEVMGPDATMGTSQGPTRVQMKPARSVNPFDELVVTETETIASPPFTVDTRDIASASTPRLSAQPSQHRADNGAWQPSPESFRYPLATCSEPQSDGADMSHVWLANGHQHSANTNIKRADS